MMSRNIRNTPPALTFNVLTCDYGARALSGALQFPAFYVFLWFRFVLRFVPFRSPHFFITNNNNFPTASEPHPNHIRTTSTKIPSLSTPRSLFPPSKPPPSPTWHAHPNAPRSTPRVPQFRGIPPDLLPRTRIVRQGTQHRPLPRPNLQHIRKGLVSNLRIMLVHMSHTLSPLHPAIVHLPSSLVPIRTVRLVPSATVPQLRTQRHHITNLRGDMPILPPLTPIPNLLQTHIPTIHPNCKPHSTLRQPPLPHISAPEAIPAHSHAVMDSHFCLAIIFLTPMHQSPLHREKPKPTICAPQQQHTRLFLNRQGITHAHFTQAAHLSSVGTLIFSQPVVL